MAETEIWVCASFMDTTLIKGFASPFDELPRDRRIEIRKEIGNGYPVREELFPSVMWASSDAGKTHKNLPDLFIANGFWCVSAAMADVLQRIDLGKTRLYPVEMFNRGKRNRIPGEFFCAAWAERKDTFLPERTPRAKLQKYQTNLWDPHYVMEDGDLHLSERALEGPDLWFEERVTETFFLSDRLQQALRDAKLTRRLRLARCVVSSATLMNKISDRELS